MHLKFSSLRLLGFHNSGYLVMKASLCANYLVIFCSKFQARVHDESLRYVLSDQAVIALVEKRPKSEKEIYTVISVADKDNDSLTSSFSMMSPSPVTCSHWDDIYCLLEGQINSADDILQILLHKHLGPKGTCSLSAYNYNLLSGFNLKLVDGSMSKKNEMRRGKFVTRKASRQHFVQKFSCKAPVYHNCRIYASDGRLLCYCDRRKLEWLVVIDYICATPSRLIGT